MIKTAKGNTDYNRTITFAINKQEYEMMKAFCNAENMKSLVKVKDLYKNKISRDNSDKHPTQLFDEMENIDAYQDRAIVYRLFYIKLYSSITNIDRNGTIRVNPMTAFGLLIVLDRQKKIFNKEYTHEINLDKKKELETKIKSVSQLQNRIGKALGAEDLFKIERNFYEADLPFIIQKTFESID